MERGGVIEQPFPCLDLRNMETDLRSLCIGKFSKRHILSFNGQIQFSVQ